MNIFKKRTLRKEQERARLKEELGTFLRSEIGWPCTQSRALAGKIMDEYQVKDKPRR